MTADTVTLEEISSPCTCSNAGRTQATDTTLSELLDEISSTLELVRGIDATLNELLADTAWIREVLEPLAPYLDGSKSFADALPPQLRALLGV